ncbi:MAG: hypothetical protein KIS66_01995 [Fimbriimonadaceae bacterium]|nr:hypothetical protein [Fimbriimonadaceae bacterium]
MQDAVHETTCRAFRAALSLCHPVTPALPLGRLLNNLDRYALQGTFYVYPAVAIERAKLLRTAAIAGHELGNGALTGLADENGLLLLEDDALLEEEFAETERFLSEVLRSSGPRSFCYPLPAMVEVRAGAALAEMTQRHGAAIVENVASRRFRFGRGSAHGRNDPRDLVPLALRTVPVPESEPETAILLAEEAVEAGAWTILSFQCARNRARGPLVEAHERLCGRLDSLRRSVLVGGVQEVGSALLDGKLRLGG